MNCFDSSNDYFLQDPLLKNAFEFQLLQFTVDEKKEFIDIGFLDLDNKTFRSFNSPDYNAISVKDSSERIISCFKEDVFKIQNPKVEIDIHKKDLYVLGYDIDLIKHGEFRNREVLGSFADKQREILNQRRNKTEQKQERPTNQRKQVLAALRHMADLNSGRPHSDAEVLLAHAITKGLEMPANPKTVAKHMYPDQNIDDYED